MDIDYVITWVDGVDARHKAKRQQFASETHFSPGVLSEKQYEPRYSSDGEIYYNIASVLKYAPFIRRIFIVTDNQKPALLDAFVQEGKCKADFLQLVSHDEIFAGLEAARPTFNSLAIETVLWRIPGLSEHFIYGNDDVFFNAPVTPNDFFRNGLPVFHGKWKRAEDRRLKYKLRQFLAKVSSYRNDRPRHRIFLWRGAALARMKRRYLCMGHYSFALRKSTFERFFAQNPDVLKRQLSFRYRNEAQFNSVSLANHLEMVQNGIVPVREPGLAYVDEIVHKTEMEKIRQGVVPFGCIQGMGGYKAAARMRLHRIMIEKFADTLPESVKHMLMSELAVS
ncbi:MAG: Hypothetical protein BHV28_11880 [Candidatus Tokpelaia hoelldobleri]|uniref:Stealth protein CR2 conserved region 2 domain-containing protein n=1 Tax=Candidatus Tokpelaia hoelldobleri TaxID=1902579 RepID=A0A1U9JVH0_9HYPH|nr:MAG: Hypothetical protein BHV28_11880 [Candidatus Tokpelaia hoelldoblerii]